MKEGFLAWKALGMSYLLIEKNHRFYVSASVFAGVGVFAFPFQYPWFIIFPVVSFLAGILVLQKSVSKRTWVALSSLTFIFLLNGTLSPVIATSILSSSLLIAVHKKYSAISLAIISMQMSSVETIQQILAEQLFLLGLETSGPALLAILILWLSSPNSVRVVIYSLLTTLIISWVVNIFSISPLFSMLFVAIPSSLMGSYLVFQLQEDVKHIHTTCPLIFVIILTISWIFSMPRTPSNIYVYLPKDTKVYESQYYKNYVEVLRFSGIDAQEIENINLLPNNSLLLLPWLTSKLPAEESLIASVAKKKKIIVVMAGEHTNYGEIAVRVESITGRSLLRYDLSTPHNNSDYSGSLRSNVLTNWPSNAILNRGASIPYLGLFQKTLLTADAWWAEPNLFEPFWTGDYIWRKGDRRGRLALAASWDDGGARFVIIGDNSPFLNRQILADPRPMMKILDFATLWPLFIADLFLLLSVIIIFVLSPSKYFQKVPNILVFAFLFFGVLSLFQGFTPSQAWHSIYINESGFDGRNFNAAIAEKLVLLKSNWKLYRASKPVAGVLSTKTGNEIHFINIQSNYEVNGVKFRNCRRLGSLNTDQGPYLMDAQVCKIEGNAKVLVGSKKSAAIVDIKDKNRRVIVILDTAFLANRSPNINRDWLSKILASKQVLRK